MKMKGKIMHDVDSEKQLNESPMKIRGKLRMMQIQYNTYIN